MIVSLLLLACSETPTAAPEATPAPAPAPAAATGSIQVKGSDSEVNLVQRLAEEFMKKSPGASIAVTGGGSGAGIAAIIDGTTTIANSSRDMKGTEKIEASRKGVDVKSFVFATDGLAVIVNSANPATSLDLDTLGKIYRGELSTWETAGGGTGAVSLYGRQSNSGTYDYFTRAIVGSEHSSRGDFTASEDDNILVQGISADRGALGFMGLDYTTDAADRMRIVPIDDGDPRNGDGPILPTPSTVADATYQPLTRPVFLYVRADQAKRPDVQAFVRLLLGAEGRRLMTELGEVALSEPLTAAVRARFDAGTTGTMFPGGSQVGVELATQLGIAPAVTP